MKKVFTLIAVGFLALIVCLVLWRLVLSATEDETTAKQDVMPLTVKLEHPSQGTMQDIGSFTGTLEADSTFTVSPKASGRLTELNFKLGDTIEYGAVVARLDDREQALAVQEETAALLVAQANVDSATAEVDKAEVEIRSAEANVQSSKALIESAEVQVENSQVQVSSAKVTLKSTLVKVKNAQNDVTTARNNIASEEANLAGANAQLNLAKQDLEREQKGVKDETSTQADLDKAQANFDVQQANVLVAQSKLATAKNNLSIALTEVEMAENDRDIAQSKIDIAESELKIARTKVTVAKTDLVNAIAKVDNARTAKVIAEKQVVIAKEQVKKQEAVLAAAKERHSYTVIRAEWAENDGSAKRFVSERHTDPGALLTVNAPVITIIDNTKLKVAVTAVEKDFARLQVGQKATIYVQVSQDGNPLSKDNEFQGTIIRKSPVIDDVSRQGRFEIEIDNKDGRLHPGAFARIDIIFLSHENCVIMPEEAIVQRDDRTGVFLAKLVEKQLTAVFVPVTRGITYKNRCEVIAETAEMQKTLGTASIVTMGNHLLKDGSLIRLPEEQKKD